MLLIIPPHPLVWTAHAEHNLFFLAWSQRNEVGIPRLVALSSLIENVARIKLQQCMSSSILYSHRVVALTLYHDVHSRFSDQSSSLLSTWSYQRRRASCNLAEMCATPSFELTSSFRTLWKSVTPKSRHHHFHCMEGLLVLQSGRPAFHSIKCDRSYYCGINLRLQLERDLPIAHDSCDLLPLVPCSFRLHSASARVLPSAEIRGNFGAVGIVL